MSMVSVTAWPSNRTQIMELGDLENCYIYVCKFDLISSFV